MARLGIVACGGALPGHLIGACRASGRDIFVIAIEGQADPAVVADTPHLWVRLGAAGRALARLHAEAVEELVLVGSLKRPSIGEVRPDGRFLKFLAKGRFRSRRWAVAGRRARARGGRGFRIVGPDSLLGEHVATAGPYGAAVPDAEAEQDIARGVAVQRALGAVDVGQGVVVQQGIVLGVEAVEGTDALLERCVELRRKGVGGVLVKLPSQAGASRRSAGDRRAHGAPRRAGRPARHCDRGRRHVWFSTAPRRRGRQGTGLFVVGSNPRQRAPPRAADGLQKHHNQPTGE